MTYVQISMVGLGVFLAAGTTAGENSTSVKGRFAAPPREYSSGPLWVWNDMLTEEQIRQTMNDLAGQHVQQVFVHPRPGLMTTYLSEDWFRLWKVALEEAERLDMNVWIYDENSYPSGFAGGYVPEAMPESQGLGVEIKKGPAPAGVGEDVLAVYAAGGENVTERLRTGEALPDGEYWVATLQKAGTSPWFGGTFYVDLLRPGVTSKFLELTLEPYRERFGEQFGKRIPGSFTDEPHLRPAKGLHWTPDLPEVFEKRWGYSLLDSLPSLVAEVGDWKRVRHNYHQTLLDLFIERWAKPYYEYCAKNNLEFTGHYWEHSWPETGSAPDNMAMAAWQQRPGIDMLFNQQWDEGPHAQVGNVRAIVELASVANQMGRKRTLCEAYGGGGWDMRFEDMKRIGDWLCVLGVNTLNQHLSHVTLRGARKGDYPPTFSYHNPCFESYHVQADYFRRVSLAVSSGEQINEVLVLEPTTTVWMYQATGQDKRDAVGQEFQSLVQALALAQVEFDIGCEDIIEDHCSVDGAGFVVGKRRYTTVVIPPMTENLNAKTVELIEAYVKNGGTLLFSGEPVLSLMDGQASDRAKALTQGPGLSPQEAVARLAVPAEGRFAVRRKEGDAGRLFHQRRVLDDGELVFLTNMHGSEPTSGTIWSPLAGVEQWDLDDGTLNPFGFRRRDGGVAVDFELPPCGSLLLFFAKTPMEPAAKEASGPTALPSSGDLSVRRDGPNVLTLDYLDVTAGGETRERVHFAQAAEFAFQKNGMERNPWDHAVQFRDEFVSMTFPPESGFEAKYRFTIADAVPAKLEVVVERPDLYTITCNGQAVTPEPGAWWLDRAFGRIDVSGSARVGENEIVLKASPFTVYHEIQPVYALGEFSLKASDAGFVIHPDRALGLGAWNKQGCPLYGHGVTYTQRFNLKKSGGRYWVELPAWYGSVVRIGVNGKEAGHVYRQPYECDVTDFVVDGENTVEVTVVGTLKNTLGPHHEDPPLGIASPDMFRKGPAAGPPPGAEYSTVGYGLFEPFVLSVD